VETIAADLTGHLRDPSSVVRDGDGVWHFWTDYIPLSQGTSNGWHAFLHHYTATNLSGAWTNHGISPGLNWSVDATAFDSYGMLSSSAVFSAADNLWFIFYTGTSLSNYDATLTSAQGLAAAQSPYGPWTKLGVVCAPSGTPPSWNLSWHARRCDSGRAQTVDGFAGLWTKGVRGESFAQEGVFFPVSHNLSFMPPYTEWPSNPIFNASDSPGTAADGYENCEFFRCTEDGYLHVICQDHSGAGQPHFVTLDALHWMWVENIDTSPALEPTPVYDGPTPGDTADVDFFIARAESGSDPLHIDLFSLTWV
jgi:hypothetical protein